MPSGTGVIGPSGVLTGSFSVGRKHVPSDNYRDETSYIIQNWTYILPSPSLRYQSKNMLLWQHYFRRWGYFYSHDKPGHESKHEFRLFLFDLKLLNNVLSAILAWSEKV